MNCDASSASILFYMAAQWQHCQTPHLYSSTCQTPLSCCHLLAGLRRLFQSPALTCGCLILFKTMLFVCAWVLTEFLPHPVYPRITKLIFDEWQEVWNCCAGNKLHAITPTVDYYKQKTCLSCHGRVLLNRLRIGHTRLTHSVLLSGDDLPECETHSGWMCWS